MAQANVKYTTSSKDISVLNPLCKALGDPLRIEILKVLQKMHSECSNSAQFSM